MRLIEALEAIGAARSPVSYRQAFCYLGIYLCACGARRDRALERDFARADRSLRTARKKQGTTRRR